MSNIIAVLRHFPEGMVSVWYYAVFICCDQNDKKYPKGTIFLPPVCLKYLCDSNAMQLWDKEFFD